MRVTAFASQPPAAPGSGVRQQDTFSTAMGSRVTTSRTATPAQTQLWNASHQCSGPLTSTGPCASSAVPMPLVPTAHSDQQYQGARWESLARARVVVVTPRGEDAPAGVGDGDDAAQALHLARRGRRQPAQLGEDHVVFEAVVDLGGGGRGLGEVRVDPVLLPAPVPGDHHLRPHAADVVVAADEPLPSVETPNHRPLPADGGASRCTSFIMMENRLWPISTREPGCVAIRADDRT